MKNQNALDRFLLSIKTHWQDVLELEKIKQKIEVYTGRRVHLLCKQGSKYFITWEM